MIMQPTVDIQVGGSIPGWPAIGAGQPVSTDQFVVRRV